MSLLLFAEREHFEDEEEFIIFSSSTTLQFHSDLTPLAASAAAAHGERDLRFDGAQECARPSFVLFVIRAETWQSGTLFLAFPLFCIFLKGSRNNCTLQTYSAVSQPGTRNSVHFNSTYATATTTTSMEKEEAEQNSARVCLLSHRGQFANHLFPAFVRWLLLYYNTCECS